MKNETQKRIEKLIDRSAELGGANSGSGYAIAYALLRIADAGSSISYQLKCLGTGNAMTEMGAVEFLASEVKAGMSAVAAVLNSIAERDLWTLRPPKNPIDMTAFIVKSARTKPQLNDRKMTPVKTDLDDELRALWAAEPPLMQTTIMERLGIHRPRLMRMVARLGLPDRAAPPPAPKRDRSTGAKAALEERRKLLSELWQDTLTRAEIAERLGVSEDAVRSMAGRMHLPPRAIDQPVRQPERRDFAVDFRAQKPGVARDHDADAAAVAEFIAKRGVTRPSDALIDVDAVMNAIRRTGRVVVPRKQGEYRDFLVDGKRADMHGVPFDRAGLLALANRCRARPGVKDWTARDVQWRKIADQEALRKHIATKPKRFQRGMVEIAVREGRLDAVE